MLVSPPKKKERVAKPPPPGGWAKKPQLTKAERRELQNKQRAAKAATEGRLPISASYGDRASVGIKYVGDGSGNTPAACKKREEGDAERITGGSVKFHDNDFDYDEWAQGHSETELPPILGEVEAASLLEYSVGGAAALRGGLVCCKSLGSPIIFC